MLVYSNGYVCKHKNTAVHINIYTCDCRGEIDCCCSARLTLLITKKPLELDRSNIKMTLQHRPGWIIKIVLKCISSERWVTSYLINTASTITWNYRKHKLQVAGESFKVDLNKKIWFFSQQHFLPKIKSHLASCLFGYFEPHIEIKNKKTLFLGDFYFHFSVSVM